MNFKLSDIRSQFPILDREVNGNPLIYMDNAATSQKPQMVLDAIENYYGKFNANVHRGIHTISQEATIMMEDAREKVRAFINAEHVHEIIFTKGTTEGINLVANVLREVIKPGDEIITTEIEHHSNIVPWQMLCERTGAKLKYIPLDKNGRLQVEKLDELLTEKTKLVTINQISNALGVINPVEEIITKAHQTGAWVLIDGAQSIPHTKVDIQKLDADFFIFSGHKMYAPTGTGILYGKENILNELPPFHGGGEMIKEVWMDHSTYAGLPFKFEAGTPNIEGNIVLGTAIDFMNEIGIENIHQHENELVQYTTEKLSELEEIIIYGKNLPRSGAVSFNLNLKGVHPSDVGMILDKKGIAVRTGHHCAQPIMRHFQIPGTVRASFAVFNTKEEVDQLIAGVKQAIRMLA
ncbi:aminotransferase class V-fold PLP-dependent enzyme [Moheibacter sediminis]|uniref:Probable cysteine desulfurase n=1 Tax=Moheibacter sediminis TaxID=1434700 RepID=A0A1W2AAN5_9FLAO|nr:cysteine desulfurase [Moheibacter sediminis]SMC57308.1 cysteine desulfurase / selenocysteine lyase [Moheibacter sediminis]